jgi:hypothetical protein
MSASSILRLVGLQTERRQWVAGAFSCPLQADQALVDQCLIVLLDRDHQTVTLIADGDGRADIIDHRQHNRAKAIRVRECLCMHRERPDPYSTDPRRPSAPDAEPSIAR